MSYQGPKGCQDTLPSDVAGLLYEGDKRWTADVARWAEIERVARATAELFGYREVRPPIFEFTELFARAVGEVTDIVQKEMFTIPREKGDLTLRPELTAGIARIYVENALERKSAFQKLYYIGPAFRHENVQSGRLWQFHQFGVEALGTPTKGKGAALAPRLDAESVALLIGFLRGVGIRELRLRVNTIGCANCRPAVREAFRVALEARRKELCHDCQGRIDRNVFRVLDCKKDVAIATTVAEAGRPALDKACLDHEAAFESTLGKLGIPFERDPRLVRGLDYYTRTVYEVSSPVLGAQDALGGGGRYDGLLTELGAREDKEGGPYGAVGFAVGLERVLLALGRQAQKAPDPVPPFDVLVVPKTDGDAASSDAAFALLAELRGAGLRADTDHEGRSLRRVVERAVKLRVPCAVFVDGAGATEVKDFSEKEQKPVDRARLIETLRRLLAGPKMVEGR
jgi:histidyl-tRNA synthetase